MMSPLSGLIDIIQEPETSPLCKDCKHVSKKEAFDEPTFYRCFSPNNVRGTSLIDGRDLQIFQDCTACRYSLSGCGLSGKWFEKRVYEAPTLTKSAPKTTGNKLLDSL